MINIRITFENQESYRTRIGYGKPAYVKIKLPALPKEGDILRLTREEYLSAKQQIIQNHDEHDVGYYDKFISRTLKLWCNQNYGKSKPIPEKYFDHISFNEAIIVKGVQFSSNQDYVSIVLG